MTPAPAISTRAFLGLLVLLLGVILSGVWLGSGTRNRTVPSTQSSTAAPPTHVSTDPVDIFQRAFWRHPTAEDQVLHAERREWSDADGVQRWEWFLAVQPGPALLADLRDHNVLQLHPCPAPRLNNAPNWFTPEPAADVRCRESLWLFFDHKGHVVHATSAGKGFATPVRH